MDYTKFYTPPEIANVLIRQLNISKPISAIDICCGSFNLLHAAKKRWKDVNLIGVDIVEHFAEDVKCTKKDGREYAIKNKGKYPLVLANPPLVFLKNKKEFPQLYSEIPFKYETSRLEIEMLFANLMLLENNGTLVIILPSTIINSKGNKKIREYLANKYHVQQIIKLPEDTFGTSRISAYVIYIKKECPYKKKTIFSKLHFNGKNYEFLERVFISSSAVKDGIWDLSFPCNNSVREFDFKRGTISSNLFIDSGIPVLHTNRCFENWRPSLRYIENIKGAPIYADNGDIIVSRVGKSAGKWCVHMGERVLISDCLYRIKDPEKEILNKINGNEYNMPLRGVAARYITMQDVYAWYESLDKAENKNK